MKLLSVLLILSFALLSVHASEEDDHHRREIVKRASELCHDFREDRLCFAQCKNLHMIQLGHSFGLNNQVCRSECESAANLCSSFGPEALQKAKLGVCSHIEEDDNQNCVSNIPSEIRQPMRQTDSQMCRQIYRNIRVANTDNLNLFTKIDFDTFPKAQRTAYHCGGKGGNICRKLNETMSFSCVNTTNSSLFTPVPCNTAVNNHLFPLCPVRYEVDAGCRTIACCRTLNDQAIDYYKRYAANTTYNGRAFFMEFVDSAGRRLGCSSFANGEPGNRCIQKLITYGSSDYSVCRDYQVQFNHFASDVQKISNDDLSFSLFD